MSVAALWLVSLATRFVIRLFSRRFGRESVIGCYTPSWQSTAYPFWGWCHLSFSDAPVCGEELKLKKERAGRQCDRQTLSHGTCQHLLSALIEPGSSVCPAPDNGKPSPAGAECCVSGVFIPVVIYIDTSFAVTADNLGTPPLLCPNLSFVWHCDAVGKLNELSMSAPSCPSSGTGTSISI